MKFDSLSNKDREKHLSEYYTAYNYKQLIKNNSKKIEKVAAELDNLLSVEEKFLDNSQLHDLVDIKRYYEQIMICIEKIGGSIEEKYIENEANRVAKKLVEQKDDYGSDQSIQWSHGSFTPPIKKIRKERKMRNFRKK